MAANSKSAGAATDGTTGAAGIATDETTGVAQPASVAPNGTSTGVSARPGTEEFKGVPEEAIPFLEAHWRTIRTKIINEARRAAESDGRRAMVPADVSTAAMKFAPGRIFEECPPQLKEPGFWQRMGSSLSAVTLISALLAVLFGVLFLATQLLGAKPDSSYTDIMKIFAGAVAGSTGAAVIASRSAASKS
jgi:hypothetical protein